MNEAMRDELIEVYGYLARLVISVTVSAIPSAIPSVLIIVFGGPSWLALALFFLLVIAIVPVPLVWLGHWQDRKELEHRASMEAQAAETNRFLDEQEY